MSFDLYRPEQLNMIDFRSFYEWSMHHWLDAKYKESVKPFQKECEDIIYDRALKYGLRPEFAREFADQ